MLSRLNLDVSMQPIAIAGSVQGYGLGLFFVPLAVTALSNTPKGLADEAAGLFNFARGIGSAIGISLLTTVVTRETQRNWNLLSAHISPLNQNLKYWLSSHSLTLHSPTALKFIVEQVAKQASMLAFINTFAWVAIAFLVLLPVVFLLSRPEKTDLI